jgi:predicted Fe-Mo cluster-binding NifX family protein
MKIVISSKGSKMDDTVDPRFGRCSVFLLMDTDTNEIRAVTNDAAERGGGAGVEAAQTVVDLGAEAVITGQIGPKAAQVLETAGIPVYTGASGTGREALEAFESGQLNKL